MKLRITVEGIAYDVDVEVLENGNTGARVTSLKPAAIPSTPSHSEQFASPASSNAADGKQVKSPIAGHVLSVVVKAGDKVEMNDTLLVLEAMKMESTVASPIAGTVKTVRIDAGDAVRMGDVLVEFE